MAIAVVCYVGILVAGCEPEPTSSVKQERLYAAENMELKKQIKDMKKKHGKELAAKQELINECEKKKQTLLRQANEEANKMFEESVMSQLMDQVEELKEENKKLRAQLEELTR